MPPKRSSLDVDGIEKIVTVDEAHQPKGIFDLINVLGRTIMEVALDMIAIDGASAICACSKEMRALMENLAGGSGLNDFLRMSDREIEKQIGELKQKIHNSGKFHMQIKTTAGKRSFGQFARGPVVHGNSRFSVPTSVDDLFDVIGAIIAAVHKGIIDPKRARIISSLCKELRFAFVTLNVIADKKEGGFANAGD